MQNGWSTSELAYPKDRMLLCRERRRRVLNYRLHHLRRSR